MQMRLNRLATIVATLVVTLSACSGGNTEPATAASLSSPGPTETATPITGSMTILAGLAGGAGLLDGDVQSARFSNPVGIVHDSADNLCVADSSNIAIRRVSPEGKVTTLAGGSYAIDLNLPGAIYPRVSQLAIEASGRLFGLDEPLIRVLTIDTDGRLGTFLGAGIPNLVPRGNSDTSGLTRERMSAISLDGSGFLTAVAQGQLGLPWQLERYSLIDRIQQTYVGGGVD